MADSNPFAHLGLGMLGADAGIARAAGSPQPIFEKNPLGALTRGLIAQGMDKLGITDYLNSFGKPSAENQQQVGIVPPVAGTGVNPMMMGVAPPGSDVAGLGLQGKQSVEGIQPRPYVYQGFGGPGAFSLPQSSYQIGKPAADDTHNQIRSAWGS